MKKKKRKREKREKRENKREFAQAIQNSKKNFRVQDHVSNKKNKEKNKQTTAFVPSP